MRLDMERLQRLGRLRTWWAGELGRQCLTHSQVGVGKTHFANGRLFCSMIGCPSAYLER